MCNNQQLSKKGNAIISYCPDCGIINIWHQNLLLAFTAQQFTSFLKFAMEFDFEERSHTFPDGSERVILCSPNRDINFVFSADEWEDFHDAMEEATYMHNVYEMINAR